MSLTSISFRRKWVNRSLCILPNKILLCWNLSMVLEPQIFVAEPPLCMSWMIGIVSERLKWAYVKRWRMKCATVCCSRMWFFCDEFISFYFYEYSFCTIVVTSSTTYKLRQVKHFVNKNEDVMIPFFLIQVFPCYREVLCCSSTSSKFSGGSRTFLRGGNSQSGCANLLFFKFVAENCMKMKEFGPLGACPWCPPRSANDLEANDFHDTMQLCNLLKWHMRCFVTALQRSSVVSVHQSVSHGGRGRDMWQLPMMHWTSL